MKTLPLIVGLIAALSLPIFAQEREARPDRAKPESDRARPQVDRPNMQRQQRQPSNQSRQLLSTRILSIQPELLERAGVEEAGIEKVKEMRASLREEIGPLMRATQQTEEALREAMRDMKASKEDLHAKLEAASKAQLALRKKDIDTYIAAREAIGEEAAAKIAKAQSDRTASFRERMAAERPDARRPDARPDAGPTRAAPPWLEDKGERIQRPQRPKLED